MDFPSCFAALGWPCIYTHYSYIVIGICHVFISFNLVAVMEDSSTTESDKEEKEQTTQDPDLATGKHPPQYLE